MTRNESQKGREWRGSCFKPHIVRDELSQLQNYHDECDRASKVRHPGVLVVSPISSCALSRQRTNTVGTSLSLAHMMRRLISALRSCSSVCNAALISLGGPPIPLTPAPQYRISVFAGFHASSPGNAMCARASMQLMIHNRHLL